MKRLLGRAREALGGSRKGASQPEDAGTGRLGLLSVVIDATDDQAPFLDECLGRLLAHRVPLRVVVSTHGPADEVRAVAARHAAADERVTVLPGSSTSVAGARTAGLAAADGDYLAFASASDVVPTGGYGALVRSLSASGSNFAVGRYVVRRGPAVASRLAPETSLQAVTVSDVPEALTDTTLGNRVFRRSFWDSLATPFDKAAGAHDVLAVLRATLRATAFDVLTAPAYQRHERALRAPIGTIRPVVPVLDGWLRQVTSAEAEVPPGLRGSWLRALLDSGVQPFLADAEAADERQWQALVATTDRWLTEIGGMPEHWSLVFAEHRVRAWLCAQDRRNDLQRFVAERWYENRHLPTVLEDGVVVAGLPLLDEGTVPRDLYEMADAELPLVASLRDLEWTTPTTCVLTVFAFVRYLDLGDHRPALTATLVHAGGGPAVPLSVAATVEPAVTAWANDRYQSYDAAAFRISLDLAALGDGAWDLRLVLDVRGVVRTGGLTHLFPRGPVPRLTVREAGGTSVRLECTAGDPLRVVVGGRSAGHESQHEARVSLDAVEADRDRVRVWFRGPGRPPAPAALRLVSARAAVGACGVEPDGDRFVAEFPTRRTWWGRPDVLLPSADYRVEHDGAAVGATSAAFAACARDQINELFRWGLRRDGQRAVVLQVRPPLDDENLGAFAQERLLVGARDADLPIEQEGVYFQSYDGTVAGDSQRALHEELRRRGSRLTLYWGVSDHATELPEGAVPLVIGSPEWHRKLASVRYLCSNVDFERRFRKRDGQLFLQTFHGYPSKAMGIGLWRAKGYSPLRIEAERRRTCADWDLIITPTPEMDAHYREQYAYAGPIFDRGLPRNDALRSEDADEVRRRVRAMLGIGDDQTAVLYAPTWRDDVATGYESAPPVTHLDVARTARALGDSYVLLMRGHRFHVPAAEQPGQGAQVLEVADYPDINDLVLASDVGVFDYSSLRFDFALTGRPMLFLVPDLHLYTGGGRGFLFDYRESAPGPLLEDGDQVVAALRDLATVQRDHAAAYERFNARFNAHHDGHAAERLADAFFGVGQDEGTRGD